MGLFDWESADEKWDMAFDKSPMGSFRRWASPEMAQARALNSGPLNMANRPGFDPNRGTGFGKVASAEPAKFERQYTAAPTGFRSAVAGPSSETLGYEDKFGRKYTDKAAALAGNAEGPQFNKPLTGVKPDTGAPTQAFTNIPQYAAETGATLVTGNVPNAGAGNPASQLTTTTTKPLDKALS